MTSLVWFRNDLRVFDNPALYKAAEENTGVVAVYIHCTAYESRFPIAPVRLDFIRRNLLVLSKALAQLKINLQVLCVDNPDDICPAIVKVALEQKVERAFFNAEYPLDELHRDQAVNQALKDLGILVKRCHDRVIVPPGMIRNGQGEPYKVFTAFKKKWLQTVMPLQLQPLGKPKKQKVNLTFDCASSADINGIFEKSIAASQESLWLAGELEAQQRLKDFIEHNIDSYRDARDFPALDGTSSLSPYLAIGAISPRQCIAAVLAHTHGEWDAGRQGAECWISELIWREFYQHIVVDFPRVSMHKAMLEHTETFPWRYDEALFAAWCNGNTGVPIIDAAMRQLNETGWMHNRLRMVVAMYLTKNLQIDWRLGEKYFMEHLIDGDLAANNGGWQWSASTGTDAAPYFRIFNPISQSQRFDPNGDFIRKWIPELANLSTKQIHNPPAEFNYCAPIVDLSSSRKDTIAKFAQLSR